MAINAIIERSLDGQNNWTVLTSNSEYPGEYLDETAVPGATYNYRARITDGDEYSEYSEVATVETMENVTAPSIPQNLQASTISSSTVNLSWDAPASNGGSPIIGYRIERRLSSGSFTDLVANTGNSNTSYADGSVVAETQYYYRVSAINSAGISIASNVVTANTPAEGTSPAHKELVTLSSSTFPTHTCKYYKYLPEGYDEAANESLYCFIMLHGLGEFRDRISGTEANKDAGIWQNGPARHIYLDDDLDAIGIAPHVFICPQQPYGTNYNNDIPSDNWNFNYLAEIYNLAIGLEKVDPNKIIITGLSMGAKAAQRYASLNPDKVYKCLVIAPNWQHAVDEVFAEQVPLWVVHGQNDSTGGGFGVGTTQTKIRDINALDPTYPPKFTCPTGVGHNAWAKTYNGVGWTVGELTPDPNGGAGVDSIGNPDHNPYVWATTGDKTNIIA